MDPTKRQGSLDGSQPERAPAMSSKFLEMMGVNGTEKSR